MSIFEKLSSSWYWFVECIKSWHYCMTTPEDDGWDFFCHINTDYCKYVEEFYYERTEES